MNVLVTGGAGFIGSHVVDGLVVAEQYNCGGCHTLHMDRWDIRYTPGSLGEAPQVADYPFLSPHFRCVLLRLVFRMEQLHVLIMLDMRWDVPRFLKVGPQSRRHRMCVEHLWTMDVH